MKAFILQLQARYASIVEHLPMDAEKTSQMQYRLNTLRLAAALLSKTEINERTPAHTIQVGILGPTQAGKSTLVNLLLQTNTAGVSPLAGYTVHAQGFATGVTDNAFEAIAELFHDFERVPAAQLQADNLKQYAAEVVTDSQLDSQQPMMIWDSPDFDSVESRGYRSAVLRVIALSDLLILMVSKDKYADKSVWDMLSLVQPLLHSSGRRLLVCINKLNPGDEDVVVRSFRERYRQTVAEDSILPEIVVLPYLKGLDTKASQISSELRQQLVSNIASELQRADRSAQHTGAYQFIQQHWDAWLEPLVAEQQARQQWEAAIEQAIDAGMQRYRSGYLDHPQKYDTFNRALAELLTLLEIPGLATALVTTRKVVTWPVRKLFGFGQSMMERATSDDATPLELEDDVLVQSSQHALTQLHNLILDEQQQDNDQSRWWTSIGRALRTEGPELSEQFASAIDRYQQEFTPEIEAAAQKLYSNLQAQPAVLNTLRAARVTGDAAAVVLAVKSGGLAASDLVLAPAMLSVTTLLTESALGKYMGSIKADLKSRQATRVRQELFEGVLKHYLYTLPDTLTDNSLLLIKDSDVTNALATLNAEIDG